jgi:hypothetical protein
MDTRKLADWLQILGNVGIVIGLFFVGFQIYQDRQLKRAELAAGYFENRILANSVAMGEDPQVSIVKAAVDPDAMTPEDAYVYFLNLDNWMSLWMRYSRLEELGMSSDDWQDFSGMMLDFGTPMGVRHVERWIRGNKHALPEEFVAKLRDQLSEPERASEFQQRLDYLLGKAPLPQP